MNMQDQPSSIVRTRPIDHILERLSPLELPAKEAVRELPAPQVTPEPQAEHARKFLHLNHALPRAFTEGQASVILRIWNVLTSKPSSSTSRTGVCKISTVKTRMAFIIAFLHFLIEQDLIPGSALKKTIRLKLPDSLPRAIAPKDVRKLLSVIHNTRDRALILLLLRTGIRIGEALGLTLNDIDLRDRKVHLFQGEKNSMGRVVYFSDDALFALKRWLKRRDPEKQFLFYGQGNRPLCYSAAASRFKKYLGRAKLTEKGYTVHCLRHTIASELLNAGMHLECLQQLMGHQDIEVTGQLCPAHRQAPGEEEYFRAMAKIEKGEIDGDYR